MLLSDAVSLYLKEGKLSDETSRHYRRCFINLIDFFSDKNIESLTKNDIALFRGSLVNNTDACLYRHILAIRSILRFFSEVYDIDVLDYRKIKKPTYRTGHWGYLTEAEINKILSYLRSSPCPSAQQIYTMVCLMFSTGCRVDELVNIKIDQINWQRNEINLIVTKTGKPRIVYLNSQAKLAIQRWIEKINPTEYLFPSRQGHLNPKSVRASMEIIGKKLGIKNCHPHALRKGLAQKLLNDGVDVAYIQKFLGHDKLNTTQNYISIDPEKLRSIHKRSFGSHELYFSKKVNGDMVLELKGMATQNYSKLSRAIQKAIDEVI